MSCVDGFILPVPKRCVRAYRRMAEMGRTMWTRHGAPDYKECVGPPKDMPFDMKRMVYGGFKTLVE